MKRPRRCCSLFFAFALLYLPQAIHANDGYNVRVSSNHDLLEMLWNLNIRAGQFLDDLPRIKTVYPTGDKPLKVLSFKCPVEMVAGVTLAIPEAMRVALNAVFTNINKTGALPFNTQVVCA